MKELEIYATPRLLETLPQLSFIHVCNQIRTIFAQYPVDMFVFENNDQGYASIRLSGYYFETNIFDEETVIYTETSASFPVKFWFKIDDHKDRYIGTFLLPEEY